MQVEPNTVLIPARLDESLITLLKEYESNGQIKCEIRPSSEFEFHAACSRLLSCKVLDNPSLGGTSIFSEQEFETYLYLSSFVSMEQSQMICSAGALLSHVRNLRSSGELEDSNGMDADMIREYSLSNILKINSDALSSLQIFDFESHPSSHMANGSKEGFKCIT